MAALRYVVYFRFLVDDVMFADNWPGKGGAIGRLLKMTHRGRSLMSTIALFH